MANTTSMFMSLFLLMATLQITAWNMRSLNGAQSYIDRLANGSDILVLSEHRLYPCELHKLMNYLPNHHVHAKASSDLGDNDIYKKPGHCGLMIGWHNRHDSKVKCINVESDRICAIKMSNLGTNKG